MRRQKERGFYTTLVLLNHSKLPDVPSGLSWFLHYFSSFEPEDYIDYVIFIKGFLHYFSSFELAVKYAEVLGTKLVSTLL